MDVTTSPGPRRLRGPRGTIPDDNSPYHQRSRNSPKTGHWEAADRVPGGLSGIRKLKRLGFGATPLKHVPVAAISLTPNGHWLTRSFPSRSARGARGPVCANRAPSYLRRFCHHAFASVADRISTPPATELAAGRSRCTSHTHTGFSAGSSSRTVVASKAGT